MSPPFATTGDADEPSRGWDGGGVRAVVVVFGELLTDVLCRGGELDADVVGEFVCRGGDDVRGSDEPTTGVLGVTRKAALACRSDPLVSRCSAKMLFTPPSAPVGTVNVVWKCPDALTWTPSRTVAPPNERSTVEHGAAQNPAPETETVAPGGPASGATVN